MDCIFCKIANKEIPADILMEDGEFLVFKDINPKTPVHLLIIPRKHCGSISDLSDHDREMAGKIILKAKSAAEVAGVSKNGYRLIFNVGKDAGMEIEHLHLHLLAGKSLNFS